MRKIEKKKRKEKKKKGRKKAKRGTYYISYGVVCNFFQMLSEYWCVRHCGVGAGSREQVQQITNT